MPIARQISHPSHIHPNMEYNTFWSWADKYWILSQTNAEFRPDKYWQLGLDKYWQLPPKSHNCPEAPPVGTLHNIAPKPIMVVHVETWPLLSWALGTFLQLLCPTIRPFWKVKHIFWFLMEPSYVELPHEEEKESHGSWFIGSQLAPQWWDRLSGGRNEWLVPRHKSQFCFPSQFLLSNNTHTNPAHGPLKLAAVFWKCIKGAFTHRCEWGRIRGQRHPSLPFVWSHLMFASIHSMITIFLT